MPAADQPSRWVDGREVDKDVVFPLPIMTCSTAATLFFFINPKRENGFTSKREHKGYFTVYTNKARN